MLSTKSPLAMLIMAAALHAQEGGDLQAQILYAYHTEDINSLTNTIEELSAKLKDAAAAEGPGAATPGAAPEDGALRYHLAHAYYRFGELTAAGMPDRARRAYSECIDDLKPLLRKDVKSQEALILQGACYGALASLSTMQAVFLRARAAERLQAAEKLQPRNPRLLLIEATLGPHRQALTQLNMAAQEFDASSTTAAEAPGWGDAEAYLALGRSRLAQGDFVGARNWIEKALIAAPDYKAAQRQLASLARH